MIDAVNQMTRMTKGHKELLELGMNYAAALEKFEEKIRPQDAPIKRLQEENGVAFDEVIEEVKANLLPLLTSAGTEGLKIGIDVAAQQVVSGTMQGINGIVFAYGVISSGKTHTMHGEQKSPGIIPLAMKDIFKTSPSKLWKKRKKATIGRL